MGPNILQRRWIGGDLLITKLNKSLLLPSFTSPLEQVNIFFKTVETKKVLIGKETRCLPSYGGAAPQQYCSP